MITEIVKAPKALFLFLLSLVATFEWASSTDPSLRSFSSKNERASSVSSLEKNRNRILCTDRNTVAQTKKEQHAANSLIKSVRRLMLKHYHFAKIRGKQYWNYTLERKCCQPCLLCRLKYQSRKGGCFYKKMYTFLVPNTTIPLRLATLDYLEDLGLPSTRLCLLN